ncbi:MAG: hypothetical protein KAR83_03315 [Thermodesulfovibrionales bacterium]|nr:hypothetical protein [Thermodesulfovibrionales bacterium]
MDEMRKKMELILGNRKIFLDDIVDLGDPGCILEEVKVIMGKSFRDMDFHRVEMVHADLVKLYAGQYPGYKECSTGYHDLRHTTDVFITTARMIHGAHLEGMELDKTEVMLALVSSLLHDSGYIQTEDDTDGTGGKYTLTHVSRSVDFMKKYFSEKGFSEEDARKAGQMIECTSLFADFDKLSFASPGTETLARMVFAADLMAQMADRSYLEKLHLLYDEFVEGEISNFSGEEDLMRQTVRFMEEMLLKIVKEMNSVSGYLQSHFKARCNINRDMYMESIEGNMNYLMEILSDESTDYRTKLNRMGILKNLQSPEEGDA